MVSRLACGLTLTSLLAAAPLAIRPYLQDAGSSRAVLRWAAGEPAASEVDYTAAQGPAIAKPSVVEVPASSSGLASSLFLFTAVLEGLQPDQPCRYRLRTGGDAGEWAEFRTAGAHSFRFAVVGDSGSGEPSQYAVSARMEAANLDLVLHTGDVAYLLGSYDNFINNHFPVYASLFARVPFYPSLGNHEMYTNAGQPYLSLFNVPESGVPATARGRYYSFDRGPVHFVALDTNNPDAAMIDWLEKDLSSARAFWRIVYFHHPPYATGPHEEEAGAGIVRERIVPVLERHGVELVFCGHEHSYQRTVPMGNSGTVYVTTGGGGGPLYPVNFAPQIAVAASVHHFVSAEVAGAVLRVRAIDADGNEIDSFSLAPKPHVAAVVDALNYDTRLVAGSFLSLFGRRFSPRPDRTPNPWPCEYNQVRITLDGEPLPLLYVSPMQVNFLLPEGAQGVRTLGIRTANGLAERQILIQ